MGRASVRQSTVPAVAQAKGRVGSRRPADRSRRELQITIIRVEKAGHGKGIITLRDTDGAWEWLRAWEIVEQMVGLGWNAAITEEPMSPPSGASQRPVTESGVTDAEIARRRLEEIKRNPRLLITGAELEERLKRLRG